MSSKKPRCRKAAINLNIVNKKKRTTLLLDSSNNGAISNSTDTERAIIEETTIENVAHNNEDGMPNNPYYSRKQNELNSWITIREKLLAAMVEREAPFQSTCIFCLSSTECIVRCLDCSPIYYACSSCALKDHKFRYLHHLEIWKEDHYEPIVTGTYPIINIPYHGSCEKSSHLVTLVDYYGRIHEVMLSACRCDDVSIHLVRIGYWPVNPSTPSIAFDLSFMFLMKIMLLEGRVSTRAFIEGHRILNEYNTVTGKRIYRSLIGAPVEEFRNVAAQFETCVANAQFSSKCPACPKENPIVSMDANFGLVRKASSGRSLEKSQHPANFFLPNDDVTNFVDKYTDNAPLPQDCSTFKAGDVIRSQRKSKKLDEKGVFGVVCRHEIPLLFLNMAHGERLAYPVMLLEELLQQRAHLYITYDIACKLEAHLRKSNNPILEKITLAIPIFHCYGHKQSCQLSYSPRRITPFGLSDGEGIERLWAFVRKFASITKEMTPSHRESLLNDALQHYLNRKVELLGQSLINRYNSAISLKSSTEEKLNYMCTDSQVAYSQEQIDIWVQAEFLRNQTQNTSEASLPWAETYVQALIDLEKLKTDSQNEDEVTKVSRKRLSVQKKVARIEKEKRLTRWAVDSEEFKTAEKHLHCRQKANILRSLQNLSHERIWLCATKKRYSVGQAVENRLSKRINRVVKQMEKLLSSYNQDAPATIELKEAMDPESPVYRCLLGDPHEASPNAQRSSIVEQHFLRLAAEQEVRLVVNEAQTFVANIFNSLESLKGETFDESQHGKGLGALVFKARVFLQNRYDSLVSHFSHLPGVSLPLLDGRVSNTITVASTNADDSENDSDELLDYITSSSSDSEIE